MARDNESGEEPLLLTGVAQPRPIDAAANRVRLRAILLSVAVGTLLLGLKYSAYQITGSTAILSDTLQSIVNLIASLFALGGLIVAGWPTDHSRPYGHGKAEFFSAAFEGGMIALAAALIIKEAGEALLFRHQIRQVDFGVMITIGTGLANATLGWILLRTGRRYAAPALSADGRHVLADLWTSVAIAVGLGLVRTTGLDWLDPMVAAMVGLNLLWTGLHLVRHAAGGLLDEEDFTLLERLLQAINTNLVPGLIHVHSLRALRVGRLAHVEAHLVVPEFWTVEEAHDFSAAFEHRVRRSLGIEGSMQWHIDPCHRQLCASCEVHPCPIRVQPFVGRSWITLDEAVQPGRLGQ
jgi:cation diffusion facilitator family transporter